MSKGFSSISVKLILIVFACIWLITGFPVTQSHLNKVVIEAEARGPGGRYVRPRPADRRTARRVHRRHHRSHAGVYVYSLSSDCKEEIVSGKQYYYCDGVYYQSYYRGNDLVYVEVENPR
jgi:hypothetical protein